MRRSIYQIFCHFSFLHVDEVPCQLQKTSGYYGGVKYYEEIKDNSAHKYQKTCMLSNDCGTMLYTESMMIKSCLYHS